MEKKIEIKVSPFVVVGDTCCATVFVDDKPTFDCFGSTPEEAQANARIAAKGYLVEELVHKSKNLIREITTALPVIKIPEQERLYMTLHDLNDLLTKAETFNT